MIIFYNKSIFPLFNLIPSDNEVSPRKPSDIGGKSNGHHIHAEYAMNPSIVNFYSILLLSDEQMMENNDHYHQ
ncbi:unnamed protein product [Rotaria sp. Silwood2]|nr:unnamed protein product [Rotaria sp. Silwood2]CAF3381699.1 unnamed protein product [Rotaria sp. Silwood2]CAF4182143.1 unnamed protein product [Rotaria sp. Silwood2]CAF4502082.1 unnamed protein product [Rotaria sp. Silwood2]